MTWQVKSWRKDLARGTIESPNSDATFTFDASVATVDDFSIGEAVVIKLAKVNDALAVTWISPVSAMPNPAAHTQSSLPEALAKALAESNRVLASSLAQVSVSRCSGGVLELEVFNQEWPPPHMPPYGKVAFAGVEYVQMPTAWDVADRELVGYRWPHWKEHNERIWTAWSLEPGDVDDHLYVFSFESSTFGAFIPYVVARDLVSLA